MPTGAPAKHTAVGPLASRAAIVRFTGRRLNGGHHESRVPVTFPVRGHIRRRCLDCDTRHGAIRRVRRGKHRAAGARGRARRVGAARQAFARHVRSVLAVRALERDGRAVRRRRRADSRRGPRRGTSRNRRLFSRDVRRWAARVAGRRFAHPALYAPADQRLGRRPHGERPLVGMVDDGPLWRRRQLGRRHLRERVRTRRWRLEVRARPLLPHDRRSVRNGLADRARRSEGRALPLHDRRDRRAGSGAARIYRQSAQRRAIPPRSSRASSSASPR